MKSIIVNDTYVGDFYSVYVLEPSTISLLMSATGNVTAQFITDPTNVLPAGSFICNNITGGENFFTEIVITGTAQLIIK